MSSSTACAVRDKLQTHENGVVVHLAHIGQHGAIGGPHEGQRAAAEHLARFADADQALHPAQQRRGRAALRFDIKAGIAVDRIHDAGR